jgi:chlorocatechol 1,2-dioxygenase
MDAKTPDFEQRERLAAVTDDIVAGVRSALKKHGVSFDEYRQGMKFLMQVADSGEVPLMIDLFFNTTICEIEDSDREGTTSSLEGPYFLEDAPVVENGLAVRDGDRAQAEPMVVRGRVTDTSGAPVANAVVDVWHSTPEGRYSGIHDNIPIEYYRGKLHTDADGRFEVHSIVPVPYQIPNTGPTGALLERMGRHSWRPAHVHFKVRKSGYRDLTTQAYFADGEFVDDDCCEGVRDDLVMPIRYDGASRLLEVTFALDPDR